MYSVWGVEMRKVKKYAQIVQLWTLVSSGSAGEWIV
jgi:hypothetical protein